MKQLTHDGYHGKKIKNRILFHAKNKTEMNYLYVISKMLKR